LSAYNPILDTARDIIAPLWTRLDNRRGGTISYREDTSNAVLAYVTAAVKQYFPNIPFAATSAFVATWDSVPYHNGGGVVTFQVVLAYNVHRSFILIYYGDVAETVQPWQEVTFQVVLVSNVHRSFILINYGDIAETEQMWQVNNNGYLTFTEPLSAYNPILDTARDIIAPLWTRLDNRRGGTISYREDTSNAVLAYVTAAVKQYFPNIPFAATSAFVATWDSVPYHNGGGVVTFQVVLAYNVHRSFILIYYGDVAETVQPWQEVTFQVVLVSNTHRSFILINYGDIAETEQMWQVNNNGYLTFTEPLSAYNPTLDSARDIVAPLWTRLDNRRGGTVSYREDTSNAVLAQVTAAVNQYFPNIPFAATSAFVATWDSVAYHNGGGVVTFQVVLAYNVHRSFILIYYGDVAETGQPWQVVTFQVVLISNVDHSFILFNYGNIAETRQRWLAFYDTVDFANSNSNVNVKGRWGFHVYDVCDTLGCTGKEVCRFRETYGCGCLEGQKPNPETFDAKQFCDSSTGSLSLSRCQLFESGFPPEILHLNDPSCKGISENGRVLFHFDNEGHVCGTTLMDDFGGSK
ncbi:hypothetical protein cypCar_00033723, partial [Cyprinus carpio]